MSQFNPLKLIEQQLFAPLRDEVLEPCCLDTKVDDFGVFYTPFFLVLFVKDIVLFGQIDSDIVD